MEVAKKQEFFNLTWEALSQNQIDKKITLVKRLYLNLKEGSLTYKHSEPVFELKYPSYSSFLHIVKPSEVPKRKGLNSTEGIKELLHAIAHIEYSAIDLALDSAYRFRNLPLNYYHDWIEVALDEVGHFCMLNELMVEHGVRYGDLPVHTLLFEAAKATSHSVLHRMAVVPRYLEANGLDANPKIVQKLKSIKGSMNIADILNALNIILKEEVEHVNKGDRWFKYIIKRDGLSEDIYFDILEQYYPGFYKRVRGLNIKARLEAGFSCVELKKMGASSCQ